MEFDFAFAPGSEKVPPPICLVYVKIFLKEAIKSSKLAKHFCPQHSIVVDKPLAYFERLLSKIENQRIKITDGEWRRESGWEYNEETYCFHPRSAGTAESANTNLNSSTPLSISENFFRSRITSMRGLAQLKTIIKSYSGAFTAFCDCAVFCDDWSRFFCFSPGSLVTSHLEYVLTIAISQFSNWSLVLMNHRDSLLASISLNVCHFFLVY